MPIQQGINPANVTTTKPAVNIDKQDTKPVTDTGSNTSPSITQTNVSIKGAVKDITDILAKVTDVQNENVEVLPQEIKQLVQQLLQSSFSIDKTLAQGLGDSLQTKKYTLDQLAALGKILSQLGDLLDDGSFVGIPDNVKTILSNFRSILMDNKQYVSTADLLKTVFAMLDKENNEALPQGLMDILKESLTNSATNNAASNPSTGNNPVMNLLKEFLQTFFTDAVADVQQSAEQTNINIQQKQIDISTAANTVTEQTESDSSTIHTSDDNISATVGDNTKVPTQTVSENTVGDDNIKTKQPEQATASVQSQEKVIDNLNGQEKPITGTMGKTAPNPSENRKTAAPAETNVAETNANADNVALNNENTGVNNNAAASYVSSSFIKNNEETATALRNLTQLLLADSELSTVDKRALTDFINSNQLLSTKDVDQLQAAMQVVEKNMPKIISQTAQKENMPNLAKLWAFVQLSDLSTLEESADGWKKAGKEITDFAKAMNNSFATDTVSTSTALGQNSLDFILPVFFDEHKSYPTYVNIYNEGHHNAKTGEDSYETWFRVCCLTENVGAVEIVLRLYNKHQLNVRLAFSSEDTAISFEDYLPQFRSYLRDSRLNLTQLKIDTID